MTTVTHPEQEIRQGAQMEKMEKLQHEVVKRLKKDSTSSWVLSFTSTGEEITLHLSSQGLDLARTSFPWPDEDGWDDAADKAAASLAPYLPVDAEPPEWAVSERRWTADVPLDGEKLIVELTSNNDGSTVWWCKENAIQGSAKYGRPLGDSELAAAAALLASAYGVDCGPAIVSRAELVLDSRERVILRVRITNGLYRAEVEVQGNTVASSLFGLDEYAEAKEWACGVGEKMQSLMEILYGDE